MKDARQPAQLLHNMSCGPNATIVHTGTDACRRLRFALPGGPLTTSKWIESCQRLGIPCAPTDDGYPLLVARAAQPHPLLARLPAVASVLANAGGDELPGWTDDPDLILAVLARSTAKVFLRDQAPVIATDRFQRTVTLLVPRTWSP
ncbi:MAG: hypothetical protein KGR22_11095 [Planctomycetes bacterium]|nr:hypothetical protein [Planctomycetota bacterium]